MGRESYWLRWNRTQRLFRADIYDVITFAGVQVDGHRLLDLEALTDKFTQDTKNLAAEEQEVVGAREEIVDLNFEEAQRRLEKARQDRACNVPCPAERKVPRGTKKNLRKMGERRPGGKHRTAGGEEKN